MELSKRKCIPCEDKNLKPFDREEAVKFVSEVSGWNLDEEAKMITKEYKFKGFVEAIDFVREIADIAEMENHHPDIHIYYDKVILELWTHSINGLSENDFIVASKIDAIWG